MPQENSHVVRNIIILLTLLILIAGGIYFYAARPESQEVIPPPPPPPPPAATDQPNINNFSMEGNVIRNSPGLKPDTWFLIYDEPGAAGRTVELQITEASTCVIGTFSGACAESLLIVGARARVTGFRDGGKVFIHRYEQVDLNEKG